MATLVTFGIVPPRHPNQDGSSLGIPLYHSHLSGYRKAALSRFRNHSFCCRRYFHRSQYRMGYSLSDIRDRMEKEKGCFRKSDRVSALGIRMVLYGLGTELFTA